MLRTLSGKVKPTSFLADEVSFLERGVLSGTRLIPTRFTAEAIHLPLFDLLEGRGVDLFARSLLLDDVFAACPVDATVGDINRGEEVLARSPRGGALSRALVVLPCFAVKTLPLLAFAVISFKVPILTVLDLWV